MKRKPTLKDVAFKAGVSIATVSNTINNSKYVSEEIKEKIFRTIDDLNYIPNNLAKSLKIKETHLIGLLISDIANPFFPLVVRGIEDQLAEKGYNILLCETNSNAQREKENLKVLLGRRVEGLIVSLAEGVEEHFKDIDTPIVFFNRVPIANQYSKVCVDNFTAAYIAIEHLIVKHKYHPIGIIAGPQDLNVGRDRLIGYKQALVDYGNEVVSQYIKVTNFTMECGYQAMRELMSLKKRPRAVFTSNNALTLGAVRYLKESGFKIPDEIAIIAYDDPDWAIIVDPPLTVVRYPMYEMGVRIGSMILDHVRQKDHYAAQQVVFEPELMVRRSCGCN